MNISSVGGMGVVEMGVGEMGQIIGETGVGEMGVGEMWWFLSTYNKMDVGCFVRGVFCPTLDF